MAEEPQEAGNMTYLRYDAPYLCPSHCTVRIPDLPSVFSRSNGRNIEHELECPDTSLLVYRVEATQSGPIRGENVLLASTCVSVEQGCLH